MAAPLYEYRVHETNSFRSLRSKATEETEAVLTAYFSAVQAGRIENSMAPSPENWPGVFELMIEKLGVERYWAQARKCATS